MYYVWLFRRQQHIEFEGVCRTREKTTATAFKVQGRSTNEIVNNLSLGGGIGRRTGLKIRWTARFVGVQFPLQALNRQELFERLG